MTVSAAVRVMPCPPALVDSRNTKLSASSAHTDSSSKVPGTFVKTSWQGRGREGGGGGGEKRGGTARTAGPKSRKRRWERGNFGMQGKEGGG